MSSRAKRFAVMALAVVLALALVAGIVLAFGGTRNVLAATDVLTLDFDGTQVTMDAESQVDADDYLGLFSNNDGSTKLAYTSAAIDVGGVVKLTFADPVSAKEYPTLRIRIFVATTAAVAGDIVTTAYAVSDTELAAPLASVGISSDTGSGGEIVLAIESAKLADQSGNVQSVVLKRTGVAGGQYFFDYVQCIPLAEPQETLTVDFDGTAATIAEYPNNVCADNDPSLGVFGGTGETQMMYTNALVSGGTVTVQFGVPFSAKDYTMIDLQMAVGNWWVTPGEGLPAIQTQTVVSAYKASDKAFAEPVAAVEVTESANKVVTLTMESVELADDDGIVRSFVLRRVEDGQKTQGNLFFDFMDLYSKQDTEEPAQPDTNESKYFEAGMLVTGANPAGIEDDNVTWLTFRDHPKLDPYGLNEHNALSDINTASEFATAIKDCPTYTSGSLNAVRANKLVWALDVGGLDAANYELVKLSLFFTDWCTPSQHQFYVYGSGTTAFTNTSGEAEGYAAAFTTSNPSLSYEIEIGNVAALADTSGKIGYIYILWWGNTLDTEDEIVGTFNGTQLWLNDVDFIAKQETEEPDTYESKYFEAGTLVTGSNPAGIDDGSVTWLTFRDHPELDPYGLNEHNALSDINTKSEFATAIKDFPTYTAGAYEAVRANKLVWALDAGGLDAANYAQVELSLYFTDWCTPSQHQFYVYGSGTTAFTNASGEAEGYAAAFTTSNPSQLYTIKIDNVAALADANGKIGYIYILWWGNTLDTEDEIVGAFNGTQLWLNDVDFLIEEDVEHPTESEKYIEKDLSDLLPIGGGVTFDLESAGVTDASEEGYGAMKTMASVSVDAAYDAVEFTVTPTYTEKFSFYFVFKAPNAATTYDVGGITLWIAEDKTLIASSAGEGKYAIVAQKLAADYNGAFASGQKTKVRMEMIPGYLEGVQSGYFLYVYLNDGAEAFLSGYIENADAALGNYINIVYQDLGSDYSVVFGSASVAPAAAADVMGVTLSTNSGNTEFTTPRAKLNMDYMSVEGEQVSDLIIEGDATYNAENGFLTFNSAGTVKVHYTVTNAFGTFTSNTLELTYTGENGTGDDDNGGGLTTGTIVGIVIAAVVVVAAAVVISVVVVQKKKSVK